MVFHAVHELFKNGIESHILLIFYDSSDLNQTVGSVRVCGVQFNRNKLHL